MKAETRQECSKRGVAVIIVLGLLALLMVLGVAFSVSMRVERAGAANYASSAKTRQMVWAGLARAIGDINLATPGFYPEGDVLVSRTAGPVWDAAAGGNDVRLLYGSVTNYIPGVFLTNTITDMRAQWLPMGVGDDREGYAAYFVLNISDMIDANYAGGGIREGGTNSAELVLDGIGVDGDVLAAARAADGPFETLAQLRSLYPAISTYALTTYSRYLSDTNRLDAMYIGTTVADIEQQQSGPPTYAVARKLRDLRIALGADYRPSGADTLLLYSSLLDYVDTALEPRELNGPNANAVPLLNEVKIMTDPGPPEFRLQGVTLAVEVPLVNIETWFPFFEPAAESFKVLWDQSTTLHVGTNSAVVQTNSFETMVYPGASAATMTNECYVHESTARPTPPRISVAVTTNDAAFYVEVQVSNMRVSLASDDASVVDAAQAVTLDLRSDDVTLIHAGMPRQPIPFADISYQVNDPRLNWLSSSWTTNAPTLGSANPGQEGRRIHASNSGFLYSPLELGNLLMPRNQNPGPVWNDWDTLMVYEESGWRDVLLETFTTDPAPSIAKRGLVNPNTVGPEILATALRDMPHPAIGGDVIDDATVTAIQDLFYSAQTNGVIFSALTDVLELDWQTALSGLSEPEREAVAAYAAGLMGVRQNLFLIVVAASDASSGMGENNQGQVGWRGRQRAVALVWRDPLENEQGLHDCFIHMFKWLD